MSDVSIVPMLIDHCSPTLASLKCGSLFSIRPEDMAYTMREARALSDGPASFAACSPVKRKPPF